MLVKRGFTLVGFYQQSRCHRIRARALNMLNFTTKMNTENKIERTYDWKRSRSACLSRFQNRSV